MSRAFLQKTSEVIRISVTARQCNKSPSDVVGIEDRDIAFAFDVECAEAFYLWEREQEVTRIASLFAGMMGAPTQNQSGPFDRSKASYH